MYWKRFSVVLAAALAVLLLAAEAQAYAYRPPEGREGAECMVRVAEGACLRLGNLVNVTVANEAAMQAIRDAGLMGAFEGNVSLYEEGVKLLSEAKACLSSGDYDGAICNAMRAMEMFREAFRGIMCILEQAGVGRGRLLEAQGLIVAAERALERIQRIEKILPEDATDVKKLLDQAASLLNKTEITQLLQQGKVSDVAHRLSEANKLINEAFKALKTKAEGKVPERMSRFCKNIGDRFRELIENMAGKGLNVTGFLKEHNMTAFQESLNQFVENLQRVKGYWKDLLPQLKELHQRFENFRKKAAIAVHPKTQEGAPAIEVSVEKSAVKGPRGAETVRLRITVKNVGNATVQFPNSVYGVTIERREDSSWVLAYTPISAQVVVELKPGQAGRVEITLLKPQDGEYRVRVHGWSKINMTPVEATAGFSIP
ncbi:hypothetical protein [Thermofilum sp.]|uniref:hypothetical protein n=1 Tax=Thermofilum sp. TaxID=1961369 RepID=UPI00315E6072